MRRLADPADTRLIVRLNYEQGLAQKSKGKRNGQG
jgi:hypothetical protein